MSQSVANSQCQRITTCGLTLALTIVTLVSVAQGATFTVNTTSDAIFDLVCNSSHCSLREAIYSANLSSDMLDFVVVPAGVFTLTKNGADDDTGIIGDLDLDGATLLLGQGPGVTIIDASGIGDRVAHVLDNGIVTFRGFTITGGNPNNGNNGGGGIFNSGVLTLDNVEVIGNEGDIGGGVRTRYGGDLTIEGGSRISGNVATASWGGGVVFSGGGILTVTDSTIADNDAKFGGGGLFIGTSDATITRSTISGNRTTDSSGNGGGLYVTAGSTVSLVNSTVAGNLAFNDGGGIYVSSGQLSLHSVTISGNSQFIGGGAIDSSGNVAFLNTIIAGGCAGSGTFVNQGNSIESPENTCQLNQVVSDLLLSELGNFGGSTQTLLPYPGSPVINSANSYCLDTDQRGESRGSLCAAGAVERLVGDPFFYGGFESGDTSEWSSVVQ